MAGYKTAGDWGDVTSYGRNEIVFEGRQKDYGAFFVRSRYKKTLAVAFAIAVGIGVVGISLPLILKIIGAGKKSEDVIRNVTVHLTAPPPPNKQPPPPPPPPPPPEKLIQQLKVTPPIVSKQDIDTIRQTVHQEQTQNVGTTTQKGKDTIIAPIQGNQTIGEDPNANQVFTIVQQMPKFSGGDVLKYLAEHIQYPEMERDAGITGKVFVTFVIEKDGSITGVKVLRGVSGGAGLDKEAIRVISNMPKWSPGMQNGHSVRVQYTVPIDFELR